MYVYILYTLHHHPTKYYVGSSANPKIRLVQHNAGKCKTTNPFKPWAFKNILWFKDPQKAIKFEKYLKSGSGRAFVKKHF